MSRFYIRVYKDGERERTWGCGSRSENNKHLHDIEDGLLAASNRYAKDPEKYFGTPLGEIYKFELIKNRHGEKELYREVIVKKVVIPNMCGVGSSNGRCDVQLIKCKDETYITEHWDPRVLKLPDNW